MINKRKVDEFERHLTWQRSEALELLDEAGIAYRSIIKHVLPSYTPEECRGEGGLCGAGWELVPYEK